MLCVIKSRHLRSSSAAQSSRCRRTQVERTASNYPSTLLLLRYLLLHFPPCPIPVNLLVGPRHRSRWGYAVWFRVCLFCQRYLHTPAAFGASWLSQLLFAAGALSVDGLFKGSPTIFTLVSVSGNLSHKSKWTTGDINEASEEWNRW